MTSRAASRLRPGRRPSRSRTASAMRVAAARRWTSRRPSSSASSGSVSAARINTSLSAQAGDLATAGHRVITYDRRGTGRSGRDGWPGGGPTSTRTTPPRSSPSSAPVRPWSWAPARAAWSRWRSRCGTPAPSRTSSPGNRPPRRRARRGGDRRRDHGPRRRAPRRPPRRSRAHRRGRRREGPAMTGGERRRLDTARCRGAACVVTAAVTARRSARSRRARASRSR